MMLPEDKEFQMILINGGRPTMQVEDQFGRIRPTITVCHTGVKQQGKPYRYLTKTKEDAERRFMTQLERIKTLRKLKNIEFRREPRTEELEPGRWITHARIFTDT